MPGAKAGVGPMAPSIGVAPGVTPTAGVAERKVDQSYEWNSKYEQSINIY